MSHDSLDLVAVQRDAALLDALSQRVRPDGVDNDTRHDADPVAGLLAALVADVDDGLLGVVGSQAAPSLIPEQGRRHVHPATVLTLPVAVAPVGRRHVARAVAALVVAAAVLSVSGVAAAVSGDPLTPYKNVINVVRGEYHDVMPHRSLVVPEPKAKAGPAKAARAAEQVGQAVSPRSSRNHWRPVVEQRFSERSSRDRQVSDRHRWNRNGSDRNGSDRNVSGGNGSGRNDQDHGQRDGSGRQADGHDGTGRGDGSGTGHDSGEHQDGSGERRR